MMTNCHPQKLPKIFKKCKKKILQSFYLYKIVVPCLDKRMPLKMMMLLTSHWGGAKDVGNWEKEENRTRTCWIRDKYDFMWKKKFSFILKYDTRLFLRWCFNIVMDPLRATCLEYFKSVISVQEENLACIIWDCLRRGKPKVLRAYTF